MISEEQAFQRMSPVDQLRVPSPRVPPEEAAANRQRNARDLLSVTPVVGNVLAAQDAWDSARSVGAATTDKERKIGMAGTILNTFGALSPLPFGRAAGNAARGASSRTNIFAGPMAKTADHAALAKAQEMSAAGVGRDAIHAQTGWHQGADDKWRFEIDDSAMGVKIPRNADSGSYHAYPKAIDHPELFDAYPAMKRDRINFDSRTSDSSLNLETNPRALGAGNKKFDTSIGVEGRKMWTEPTIVPRHMDKVRGDAAHEFQHNVQTREGFSPGASPQAIFDDLMEKNPGMTPEAATEMAIDQYRRTLGEVEARNVATRLNMTAAERRAKAPWETQDVPDADQIIGDAFAAPTKANIFAGPMAKTADHAALGKAQEMQAAGVGRDAIHAQTGWHQGADKKWRFEIDDSKAGLSPGAAMAFDELWGGGSMSRPTSSAFGHPDLHKAYDDLGDVNLTRSGEAGGSYTPHRPATTFEGRALPPINEKFEVRAGDAKGVRSVALHEVQHGVQNREGFATGGASRTAKDTRAIEDLSAMRSALHGRYEQLMKDGADLIRAKRFDEGNALQRQAWDLKAQADALVPSGAGAYKRLAGEVEARNVETRMNMTAAERRAKAPWLTQDVPDEQQIVRRR